ncbi:MAG TPA: hypothetical protein VGN23_08390 [Verrucomicrobiae bacterium]
MKDQFEQISEQLHDIRNFLSPLDVRLQTLGHQIEKNRISFEARTTQLESKIVENSSDITLHSEQIRQIRLFLKMPDAVENRPAAPVHEDKQNPATLPPSAPPA